jgi:hypothetical protein
MKILLLLSIAASAAFAQMPVYEFTTDANFNFYCSIFANIAVVLVPAFAALSLIKS